MNKVKTIRQLKEQYFRAQKQVDCEWKIVRKVDKIHKKAVDRLRKAIEKMDMMGFIILSRGELPYRGKLYK